MKIALLFDGLSALGKTPEIQLLDIRSKLRSGAIVPPATIGP